MRRILAVLVLAALAGCGESEPGAAPGSRPSTGPPKYPVAYAVARDDLAELAEQPLPDAVEDADVVAESTWQPYGLMVLSEWLHERGIDLDPPPALEKPASEIGEAWEVPVFVIAPEHARRYGRRIGRLSPDEAELRAYFEEFNAETVPHAGQIMADWLAILRRSLEAARDGRVVVIPVDD